MRYFLIMIIALILTILPLPVALAIFRPAWVLLVILYIELFNTEEFRLSLLFFIGLILDALLATVIGEHTFALIFVSFLVLGKVRRFHLYSLSQQTLFIGLYCGLYQFIIYLIDAFLGYNSSLSQVLLSSLTSMLLWPWLQALLEKFVAPKFDSKNKQYIL